MPGNAAMTSSRPRLGARTPDLIELEGRVWGSWHLYEIEPDDYVRVASAVVPLVVKELSVASLVDRFFFIRYSDDGGNHVRLRLRFHDPGADPVGRVTRVVEGMAAEYGLTLLQQPFELEVERYGGMAYLPLSLEFFCLSSMAVLVWFRRYINEPKSRQLPAVMGLLTKQAVAFARSLEELSMLLDYFAGWRPQMTVPIQRADRNFESQAEKLTSLLRVHIEVTLSTETLEDALVEGARALSTATLELAPEARSRILLSQMHMTANRLGLRNTEESYVTQILHRAINTLIQKDPTYARELDTRLASQQTLTWLDMVVSRCLGAQ